MAENILELHCKNLKIDTICNIYAMSVNNVKLQNVRKEHYSLDACHVTKDSRTENLISKKKKKKNQTAWYLICLFFYINHSKIFSCFENINF